MQVSQNNSHMTKILLKVLIHKMHKCIRPEIFNKKFGCMPDKKELEIQFLLYQCLWKEIWRCKKRSISALLIIKRPLIK